MRKKDWKNLVIVRNSRDDQIDNMTKDQLKIYYGAMDEEVPENEEESRLG